MKPPMKLPGYNKPPLDEVVLGVQFAPISGYKSVHSSMVWELFKEDFPKVQELPLTESQFETFGGMNIQPNFQFQVGGPPVGSRLWFLTADDSHILQFQPDRIVTNWRKAKSVQDYPRFEGIASSFKSNLQTLVDFVRSFFDYDVDINQAEVVYVNIIPVEHFSEMGEWFSIWCCDNLDVESFSSSFTEVILDESNKPYARLKYEISSVFSNDGSVKAFRLSLTFKGKPVENDIESAMKFIATGRETIVSRFDQITTDKAHKIWEKQ